MISVRDAAAAALAFATDLLGDSLSHLRIEEIALSNDERSWKVTLGWDETAVTRVSSLANAFPVGSLEKIPRVYKLFLVDAETGKVRSMQMRETK